MDMTIVESAGEPRAMAKCIYIAYMVGISSIVLCMQTKTVPGFVEKHPKDASDAMRLHLLGLHTKTLPLGNSLLLM